MTIPNPSVNTRFIIASAILLQCLTGTPSILPQHISYISIDMFASYTLRKSGSFLNALRKIHLANLNLFGSIDFT